MARSPRPTPASRLGERCGAQLGGDLGSSSQALDGILGFGQAPPRWPSPFSPRCAATAPPWSRSDEPDDPRYKMLVIIELLLNHVIPTVLSFYILFESFKSR
jgi:hypothetical protein